MNMEFIIFQFQRLNSTIFSSANNCWGLSIMIRYNIMIWCNIVSWCYIISLTKDFSNYLLRKKCWITRIEPLIEELYHWTAGTWLLCQCHTQWVWVLVLEYRRIEPMFQCNTINHTYYIILLLFILPNKKFT